MKSTSNEWQEPVSDEEYGKLNTIYEAKNFTYKNSAEISTTYFPIGNCDENFINPSENNVTPSRSP